MTTPITGDLSIRGESSYIYTAMDDDYSRNVYTLCVRVCEDEKLGNICRPI